MSNIKENIKNLVLFFGKMAVGILFLINPSGLTMGFIIALGLALSAFGVFNIAAYFHREPYEAAKHNNFTKGLLSIIGGVFCVVKPQWFIETFPAAAAIYGAVLIIIGLVQIQWIVDMIRMKRPNCFFQALSSLFTITVAIIILINPFQMIEYLWIFTGIALIIGAIPDLIIILRKRPY